MEVAVTTEQNDPESDADPREPATADAEGDLVEVLRDAARAAHARLRSEVADRTQRAGCFSATRTAWSLTKLPFEAVGISRRAALFCVEVPLSFHPPKLLVPFLLPAWYLLGGPGAQRRREAERASDERESRGRSSGEPHNNGGIRWT